MNRRTFLSVLSALGLLALACGCDRRGGPLRIASHIWPSYEFLFLARREGWISPDDLALIETGSATESMQWLMDGKADGAALTLDEVLSVRAKGFLLTAVLVFDVSMGADVLLAKAGIGTLAELAGKRIGYERSAVGALMLYSALKAAGLAVADVKPLPVTFSQHPQAWHSGEVDALVTFEPVSSRLQGEGARRLFDSSKIPNTIFDVLAVTPGALASRRPALRRLVAAHFRGLTHFRKNPADTAYRMAERLKLSPKEVIAAFRGLELPAEARNRKLLQGGGSPLAGAARELLQIMAQAGILAGEAIDLAHLVDPAFIPRETR